jgi:uncharacterized membrane protein YczE
LQTWVKRLYQCCFFFVGLFVMSMGIVMTFGAGLGTSPWDVFHYGLFNVIGLSIGTWSQIVGLVLIGVTYLLDRKLPSIGCIFNMIFVGFFIDWIFLAGWFPTPEELLNRILLFSLGTVLVGFGAGMYIAGSWGAGPRDGLMIVLSERTGLSIRSIKTIMEVAVVGAGWMMGGPVAFGTLVFSLTIGPIMQWSILNCRIWANLLYQTTQRSKQSVTL